MRLINGLFSLLYGRALVREQSLARGPRYLRLLLEDKGFDKVDDLPAHVLVALAQECLSRAAQKEADRLARYGEYYRQMNLVADAVVSAFGGASADSRVEGILRFNRLLDQKGDDDTPQPRS